MNKFVAIGNLLVVSLLSCQAKQGIIGKPTGNLDPRKKRQLESLLRQKHNIPETKSGPGDKKKEPRDLQYYYGNGYTYNSGNGNWNGNRNGNGSGNGNMNGNGNGNGNMNGNGYGYGYDYDYDYNYGDGYGEGYGYRYGKKGYYGYDDSSDTGYYKYGNGKGGKKKYRISPQPAPVYVNENACELFVTEEHFRIPASNATSAGSDGNSTDIGTNYLWTGEYLQDSSSRQNFKAAVFGSCTRVIDNGPDSAGHCVFTIVDSSDGSYDQLQFSGVIMGAGGNLIVTGGSGAFVGLIGDAKVVALPGGDPFEDAVFYDVTLVIGLIVCPPQHDPQVFGGGGGDYYYYN